MSNPIAGVTDTPATRPDLAHIGYVFSLIAKGLLGLGQLGAGLALAVAPPGAVLHLTDWMVRAELAEHPADLLARLVESAAASVSLPGDNFYMLYLCMHGLLNLAVVLALVARLRWAYGASVAVLAGFVVYQMAEFAAKGTPLLLVLSLIDIVVIALVLHEARSRRRRAV